MQHGNVLDYLAKSESVNRTGMANNFFGELPVTQAENFTM